MYLITGSALGTGAALAAYQLFDHVRRRVAAWSNPWADIENKGYQITQSLLPLARGDGLAWDSARECRERYRWWRRILSFQRCQRRWEPFCHLRTSYLPGLFYPVHDDCSQNAGRVLQADCIWPGVEYIVQVFLTVGGVTKFIPSTGSDAALCKLRRKLHPGNLPAVWHYPGALHPETQR